MLLYMLHMLHKSNSLKPTDRQFGQPCQLTANLLLVVTEKASNWTHTCVQGEKYM